MSLKITILLSIFLLVSCAHHRDVRPGSKGIHRVVVRKQNQEQAEQLAISEAQDYCSQYNKAPGFLEEKTEYKGTMNESTRDTVHKVSNAAMILGGVGSTSRHGQTKAGGSILGRAGVVGHVMTN
jgi:DNA-binding transcriptional regulator LsrR (DeoR family)